MLIEPKTYVLLFVSFATILTANQIAEAPPKPAVDKKVISAELRAQFWRAQAERLLADKNIESIRAQMAAICAPKALISLNGEPACSLDPAPEPSKPEVRRKVNPE